MSLRPLTLIYYTICPQSSTNIHICCQLSKKRTGSSSREQIMHLSNFKWSHTLDTITVGQEYRYSLEQNALLFISAVDR